MVKSAVIHISKGKNIGFIWNSGIVSTITPAVLAMITMIMK